MKNHFYLSTTALVFSFVFSSFAFSAESELLAKKPTVKFNDTIFISNHDGDHEIYLLKKQGEMPIQLTSNDRDDVAPSWSPDGKQIIFSSMRDGNSEIYVMNADGTNQRALAKHKNLDISPSWSPDGTKILFVSNRDGVENIYLLNLKDSRLKKLTDSQAGALSPQWSPDGQTIAYKERTISSKAVHLVVIKADGTKPVKLSNHKKTIDLQFTWSPDSQSLIVSSKRKKMINLFRINLTDKTTIQLTDSITSDVMPQWSPDGKKIVFLSQRDNGIRQELFIMNADGSQQQKVIDTKNLEYSNPYWSPDGKWLTFSRYENSHFVAYAYSLKNARSFKLSPDSGFQYHPKITPKQTLNRNS